MSEVKSNQPQHAVGALAVV